MVKIVPHLEVTEILPVHCNVAENSYQKDYKVLYSLVPNKSFGQLLETSPTSFIFLNI